jgi:hypothetical protein
MPRKFDFLSPGIEINEVDQSILPAEVDADGPIIIGRFRKGPGMKPAKVRSLDNFVQVYGNPVPGGSSLKGDIWRDGPQLSAPTPAAYAAQAWLSSRTSPVNLVRLLGDQHPQASTAGYAGWQLSGSGGLQITNAAATNSTAYGLFVADTSSLGQSTAITLKEGSSFNEDAIGDTPETTCVLRFIRGVVADSILQSTGLKIEITFDESSNAYGTVTRNATGGTDSVPLYTCPVKSTGGSFNEVLAQVKAAIDLALTNGDISNIAVDDNTSTLKLFNLSSTTGEELTITDAGGTNTFFAAVGKKPSALSAADVDQDLDVTNSGTGKGVSTNLAANATGEGCLAAVFYVNSGYMTLDGIDAAGSAVVTNGIADGLVKSTASPAAPLTFNAIIYNAAGTEVENVSFNFDRTSGDYIRNKFNTNPQLVNTSITETSDQKNYWLGESFERALKEKVTSETAAAQVAALIPLHKDDDAPTDDEGNWGYQRTGSTEAKSGYLIGRNYDSNNANYAGESSVSKLFRFECIHAGEEIQKNTLIAIEDLKLATNPTVYPYGTFSVKIMDVNGGTLEKYSGCSLDPNSPNFIARRIGDMYMEWSEEDRRYRSYGDHPNVSDYVRIKMYAEYQNYDDTDLPVGFLGPGRPKTFMAIEDQAILSDEKGVPFAGSFITPRVVQNTAATGDDAIELFGFEAIKFSFPKLPLRVNGSDGYSASPYKVYFGIRPKVDSNSSLHDPDYCDYLRPLPKKYAGQQFAPSGDFEYSCVFSLNDIVVSTVNNTTTWTSGSMANSTSYVATDGLEALLNKGVKQFVLPLFGGFDGLDITEKEPFRQDLIGSTLSEKDNYLQYSLNKTIDSVSDPETVPASLLCVPGVKNPIITTKVIRTAESRKDMLAVIDLEGDYKPTSEAETGDSQSSRLGSVSSAISSLKNRQLDSSYACAYYPAVQIQDNLNNGERVWVPSSVAGLGAMAQSDASSELWFAPAGFNRGGLGNLGGRSGPRVIQARQRLDASERDDLYEVSINPIATFPNEGVVIFGQKTLQQTPSALDRINVRRLMIFLKAEIGNVARNLLFDQNVQSTWARFRSQAEPILSDVKSKFGLTDYRLVLDGTTTTPDLIDRNIMYAKIFLKPARAIEYIAIDFVITRTGAEFA